MDSLKARSWAARAALAMVVLSVAVLLAFAGRRGIWLVLLTAAAAAVVVAAGFWFLQQRGVLRWVALALVVGAPVAVLVVFVTQRLLWVALLALALWAAATLVARAALRPDPSDWAMPVVDAPDARRPFVVMNPRSGGGKVTRFGLQQRAESLGAEVALIDRPGTDVQQLARDALDRGADLLGVAGGDGTQALVAQVAAEHDVPFLVISAGTRNHFALDLGLDREDPTRCLDALRGGVEARIDLGEINGRPFVNNASFGAYAEIVDNPAYRDDKRGTALDALPDLLRGRRGAVLTGDVDGLVIDAPQALLVSNNPYEASDLAGLGRRARLDRGVLGVVAVRVDTARQAVGLLHGAHRRGMRVVEGREVLVTSDSPTVPVGIDGESVHLTTPVRCTLRPGALRVRLPRERPGVRPPGARLDWAALWGLAVGRPRTVAAVDRQDDLALRPPDPSASPGAPAPRRESRPEHGAPPRRTPRP
jgi:diacylglycerol kinase family enzyme